MTVFSRIAAAIFRSFNQHKFAALTGINIPLYNNQSLSTRVFFADYIYRWASLHRLNW